MNLTGQFLGAKAAVPELARSAPASIINVSSTAGLRGNSELHGYTASKWGVRGLTKSLAAELAPRGIRVNSIHPGTVTMPMNADFDVSARNPMGRVGEPVEVSMLVVHLASDESGFTAGAEIVVDGGELAGGPPLLAR